MPSFRMGLPVILCLLLTFVGGVDLLGVGARCSSSLQCSSQNCSRSVCSPSSFKCIENADCISGGCNSVLLKCLLGVEGSLCYTNSDCQSGSCVGGTCTNVLCSPQSCPSGCCLSDGITCAEPSSSISLSLNVFSDVHDVMGNDVSTELSAQLNGCYDPWLQSICIVSGTLSGLVGSFTVVPVPFCFPTLVASFVDVKVDNSLTRGQLDGNGISFMGENGMGAVVLAPVVQRSATPARVDVLTYSHALSSSSVFSSINASMVLDVPLTYQGQSFVIAGKRVSGNIVIDMSVGATPPFRYSLSSGAFPPGVTIGASTGVISGIATNAGVYSATVTVEDSNIGLGYQRVTLVVVDPGVVGSNSCTNPVFPTFNSTDDLVANFDEQNSGVRSGELQIRLEWPSIVTKHLASVYLVASSGEVGCGPIAFDQTLLDATCLDSAVINLPWPQVLDQCSNFFELFSNDTVIVQTVTVLASFLEQYVDNIGDVQLRAQDFTFSFVLERPSVIMLSQAGAPQGSSRAAMSLVSTSTLAGARTSFNVNLDAPCSSRFRSGGLVVNTTHVADLSATISLTSTTPTRLSPDTCRWVFVITASFTPPSTCGSIGDLYSVDFGGTVGVVSIGVVADSSCPTISGVDTNDSSFGSLTLYGDEYHTIPLLNMTEGEKVYWIVSVREKSVPVVSTRVVSFISSGDGISWTPVQIQSTPLDAVPGAWIISHAAPAIGSYNFRAIIECEYSSFSHPRRLRSIEASAEVIPSEKTASTETGTTSSTPMSIGVIFGLSVGVASAVAIVAVLVYVLVGKIRKVSAEAAVGRAEIEITQLRSDFSMSSVALV